MNTKSPETPNPTLQLTASARHAAAASRTRLQPSRRAPAVAELEVVRPFSPRLVRTTLIALTVLALLTPAFGADLPITESPQVSIALSSEQGDNANPLKLHFTRKRDQKLLAVLPAYFDQAQRDAERDTKALWSPKGDFVALSWNGGPRVGTLSVYGILPESAVEIELADYTQNILGRHRTIQQGPHRTDTFLRWVADDELLISTGGEVDDVPDSGRVMYHYHVRLRFHALHMAEPYSELIAVNEALKEAEHK